MPEVLIFDPGINAGSKTAYGGKRAVNGPAKHDLHPSSRNTTASSVRRSCRLAPLWPAQPGGPEGMAGQTEATGETGWKRGAPRPLTGLRCSGEGDKKGGRGARGMRASFRPKFNPQFGR